MLGSFLSLGGTYAGLRALAQPRACRLLAARPQGQPTLVCASDGNQGLAVAAAARFAAAPARVFLHRVQLRPSLTRLGSAGVIS